LIRNEKKYHDEIAFFPYLSHVCVAASSVMAAETAPVMDNKSCDPPKYPKAALMNEESGTVTMGFLISADGKVVESKVESPAVPVA
jgi:protein TonB